MSRGQVSAAKKELIEHELIRVRAGKNPRRNADNIRIKDIWPANMQEFSVHNMNSLDDDEDQEIQTIERNSVHDANTEEHSVHAVNTVFTIRTGCSLHEQLRSFPEEVSPKKEEKDSLPSVGSLSDAESEALTPPLVPASTNGSALDAKARKKLKPLADDDWLRALLLEYEDTLPFAAFNDHAWWVEVSQPMDAAFCETWMRIRFSKIAAYLMENPRKRPASPGGWKRFVRTWLHRDYEKERRATRGGTYPNRPRY